MLDRVKESESSHQNSKDDSAQGNNFIAVASGKGGVGKTWFSITLSHCLSQLNQKVLLFDADLGLANIDIQLGLMTDRDINMVLNGKTSIMNAIMHYEEAGFDLLAGHSGSGQLASLSAQKIEELKDHLLKAVPHYDHIILDLAAGIDRSVRQFSNSSKTLLVVTTDEPTSLTDAYACIKVNHTHNPDLDIQIVVNRAKSQKEGMKTYEILKNSCRNFLSFEPGCMGIIREDPRVADSIRHQSPIVSRFPNSLAVQDVMYIAKILELV